MSHNRHRISNLEDIMKLTPEERERAIPEIMSFCGIVDKIRGGKTGINTLELAEPLRMVWVDDGRAGEISGIEIHLKSEV